MLLRRSKRAGFSLIELLIAFAVLLIGILAILTLFPLGLRESKTMVDASMAAFTARNARNLMESQPFTYDGDGQNGKLGYGAASMVQIRFGPKLNSSGQATASGFPVMFPKDVLGEDNCSTFPIELRPSEDAYGYPTKVRQRIQEATNNQYSWDARFTVGGGIGTLPPPGKTPDGSGNMRDFEPGDIGVWFAQYYKYYAVQISVYRNYKEIPIGPGQVTVKPAPGYQDTDPNRPLYSELILSNLSADIAGDLVVGSAIRVRDENSDWYKITAMTYDSAGKKWTFRLDRPYAGGNIGTAPEWHQDFTVVIGTNTLLQSFTTLLGSQLDDIDTSKINGNSIKLAN